MSGIESHPSLTALGETLIHFLWQGAGLAALMSIALQAARERSAQFRYLIRCLTLLAMAVGPIVTFCIVLTRDHQSPIVAHRWLGTGTPGLLAPISQQFLAVTALIWVTGVAVTSARLAGGWLLVRRLARNATESLDAALVQRFERLAVSIGVRARARLVHEASVTVPVVIGWIKPVVLLPVRIATGLSDGQLDAILAHELAHIRRKDYLINLVQSLVETFLFYHPAVWWVSRGIRTEREYCCDDIAVDTTRDALSYARALAELESWRGRQLTLELSTLGGSLMHRIQRLTGIGPLNRPSRPGRALSCSLTFFLLCTASAITAAPLSQGSSNAEDEPPKSTVAIITPTSILTPTLSIVPSPISVPTLSIVPRSISVPTLNISPSLILAPTPSTTIRVSTVIIPIVPSRLSLVPCPKDAKKRPRIERRSLIRKKCKPDREARKRTIKIRREKVKKEKGRSRARSRTRSLTRRETSATERPRQVQRRRTLRAPARRSRTRELARAPRIAQRPNPRIGSRIKRSAPQSRSANSRTLCCPSCPSLEKPSMRTHLPKVRQQHKKRKLKHEKRRPIRKKKTDKNIIL